MRMDAAAKSKSEILADELRDELPQLFDLSYTPKWELYSDNVEFVDPLNKFSGVEGYKGNIQLLKDSPLFKDGEMQLHDTKVVDDETVLTRWTLSMVFKPAPWQPRLSFTGTSEYKLDPASGLVVKHTDTWDSIANNAPFSLEALQDLVGQLVPDVTTVGIRVLKGGAEESAAYDLLRRYGSTMEVRRYRPYCVVSTEPGGVYDRDSYLAASEQLMAYKGDANNKPQNAAGMVCAATEPALQFDSGKLDSSLGAILPAGFSAPKPLDKTLTVSTVSDSIVAVAKRRGFGSDRSRSEQEIESVRAALEAKVTSEGWKLPGPKGAFTLASYADGLLSLIHI